MNKIPTLFLRDENDRKYVTDVVDPQCLWVLEGEGVATRKYDGTCMRLDELGQWWQRREVKKDRPIPEVFMELNYDEITGKRIGWVPVSPQGFQHPFLEALGAVTKGIPFDEAITTATNWGLWKVGTYELCGPKINGNPDEFDKHVLIRHEDAKVLEMPVNLNYSRSKWVMKELVGKSGYEGIVWHHPDGRMAKLKVRDFPDE